MSAAAWKEPQYQASPLRRYTTPSHPQPRQARPITTAGGTASDLPPSNLFYLPPTTPLICGHSYETGQTLAGMRPVTPLSSWGRVVPKHIEPTLDDEWEDDAPSYLH